MLGVSLTSYKQGLPVLRALRWLVPQGLHVMRRPLRLTKTAWHMTLKVSHYLRKDKTSINYLPSEKLSN